MCVVGIGQSGKGGLWFIFILAFVAAAAVAAATAATARAASILAFTQTGLYGQRCCAQENEDDDEVCHGGARCVKL